MTSDSLARSRATKVSPPIYIGMLSAVWKVFDVRAVMDQARSLAGVSATLSVLTKR
jgi:hypothetical protein